METPNFFIGGFFGAGECQRYYDHKHPADIYNNNNNQFAIDDLLNFPKDEDVIMNNEFFGTITASSTVDSCNSSVSGSEPQFSGDLSSRSFSDSQFSGSELCIPYDDLAELEWLTNFGEESFSNDDLHNLQLISPTTIIPTDTSSSDTTPEFLSEPAPPRHNSPIFQTDVLIPGRARSKRSRAAPCDWTSRLLFLSRRPAKTSSRTEDRDFKPSPAKRRESRETSVRKCLHCGSDKTPQWRTGAEDTLQRLRCPVQVGSFGARISTRRKSDICVGEAFKFTPKGYGASKTEGGP